MGGERGGQECRGTVTVLSPVTHTDVQGGEKEQEGRIGKRAREQRRSKKPPQRKKRWRGER